MRTLQEKYNAIAEGNFSKAQFVRDAYQQFPNLVAKTNSFDDAAKILMNRGMIAEAKKMQEPKYSTAKPEDTIAPDVLDTGIKFELDKKFGTLDVSEADYDKARAAAIKNLAKDALHYVKQDSIQLETPGEKMEKVKLNEDVRNIESDEQTKKRIARLTNQLIQDADPRDETVKAYAVSVKRDLESGDASRMTQYKDILSLDDLKDDLEHYLTHDVDQLEESDYEPRTKEDLVFQYLRDAWQLGALKGKDFNPDEELSTMADSLITYLPDYDTAESSSGPDVEDLYQHDPEYIAQLKESIKKIITKVITE